jgi:hypothetical protein
LVISTADTTTPLSDDNVPDPTRTGRKTNTTSAPETDAKKPAAAVRRPARKTSSTTRSAQSEAPQGNGAGGAAQDRRPARKPASRTRSPKAEPGLPPKPVWAPEPNETPKLALLPQPEADVVPRPIPNWEGASTSTSSPGTHWEHARPTTRPPRPEHADPETKQGRSRRSRALTTTVVLSSLLVVFIAVTVLLVLLHHSNTATNSTTQRVAVVSPDARRLKTATQTVNADVSGARSALHSLNGFPTVGKVAAVMNPYVSSLQHYQTVLSGVEVPKSARGAAINVRALVSRDVQSLGTIEGLPPLRLGTYLEEFGSGATQLQKDLGKLEHALRTPNR